MITDVKAPPKGTGTIGYTDLYDAQIKSLGTAAVQNSARKNIVPTVASTTSAIDDVYNATASSIPPSTSNWAGVSWVNASGVADYPLATLAYMLVPQNPGHLPTVTTSSIASALKEWLAWVATEGQFYSRAYFPFPSPPAPLLTQDLSAIAGMNYNGASLPSCT
jgi:ABC-type phosphate transport system substrate-binding protein